MASKPITGVYACSTRLYRYTNVLGIFLFVVLYEMTDDHAASTLHNHHHHHHRRLRRNVVCVMTGKKTKKTHSCCIVFHCPRWVCVPNNRWEVKGVIMNSLLNFTFMFLYAVLNFTPDQIFRWYYGRKPPKPHPRPVVNDSSTSIVK